MKTTLFRVFALLFCLLLTLPILAACGGDDGAETDTDAQTTASETTESSTETEGPLDPDDETDGESEDEEDSSDPEEESEDPDDEGDEIGYRDLKGYVYKAYVRSSATGNPDWACEDFWVADVGTNILSYAVYTRNSEIEQNCNCKIVQIDSQEKSQYDHMVQANVGGTKYELAIVQTMDAAPLATGGILRDLAALDALDLNADCYDQNEIRDLSMGGALYYISGDMNISALDTATATIFNQVLLENYLSETFFDPYEMVGNGTWTLSNMIGMANLATVNATGGDLDATKGDTVGYFEYDMSPLFHFYASGERLTKNDEDGYPQFVIGGDNHRASDVVDQIYACLNVNQNPNLMVGLSAVRMANYSTGNVLFTDVRLLEIRKDYHPLENIRYGILPLPKYDEAQENYYSVINFWDYVHLWTIPVMCENVGKSCYMMELMAQKSHEEGGTMDAYYINTMELNAAEDSRARDMLKLIRRSLVYDIDLLYDWGGFRDFIVRLKTATGNTFASQTNMKNIEAAEEAMAIDVEKFKEASGR